MTGPAAKDEGRFAYDGLDRTLHERARLGIMTSLAMHPDGLTFGELMQLCNLTKGNLSRHLHALLYDKTRSAEAERPRTPPLLTARIDTQNERDQKSYRITDEGRRQLLAYLDVLEQVVRDAKAIRAPSLNLRTA